MGARTGLITNRSTQAVRKGGLEARMVQVLITEMTDTQTAHLSEQAGEESNPPVGSLATILNVSPAFKQVVSVDDGIAPVMDVGGKRLYSVASATRQPIAELRLLPSGEIQAFNEAATITVAADGTITVSTPEAINVSASAVIISAPVTIDGTLTQTGAFIQSGGISVTGEVAADTVTYGAIDAGTHVHSESGGGTTDGPQ